MTPFSRHYNKRNFYVLIGINNGKKAIVVKVKIMKDNT